MLTLADYAGYIVTTVNGSDLFEISGHAARHRIDYLIAEFVMARGNVYCLCGAAVDLKISEFVD
jgi:acetamidase/formamidase